MNQRRQEEEAFLLFCDIQSVSISIVYEMEYSAFFTFVGTRCKYENEMVSVHTPKANGSYECKLPRVY